MLVNSPHVCVVLSKKLERTKKMSHRLVGLTSWTNCPIYNACDVDNTQQHNTIAPRYNNKSNNNNDNTI